MTTSEKAEFYAKAVLIGRHIRAVDEELDALEQLLHEYFLRDKTNLAATKILNEKLDLQSAKFRQLNLDFVESPEENCSETTHVNDVQKIDEQPDEKGAD